MCLITLHANSILSFTVLSRSIVVYGTGAQRGQLLGCANIEPSLVAEEEIEISFPRNGTNPEDIDRCALTVLCSVSTSSAQSIKVHMLFLLPTKV